jgi:hypothetical protein
MLNNLIKSGSGSPDYITNFLYIDNLSRSQSAFGLATARGIAWNGSVLCVVGESGRVATSSDGSTWNYQNGLLLSGWGTANANAITNIESQGLTPTTEVTFTNHSNIPLRIGMGSDNISLPSNC